MRGSTMYRIPAHWTALIAGGITAVVISVMITRVSGGDGSATPIVELDAVGVAGTETADDPEPLGPVDRSASEPVEFVTNADVPCRVDPTVLDDSADAAVGEIIRLGDDARAGRCPDLTSEERLCRGVWFAAATDPILAVGMGISLPLVDRLVDTHRWAMSEIESMARELDAPTVARSAAAYRQIDLSVALSGDDELVIAAIESRASSEIVDGLAEAERLCEEWERAG